MTDIIKIKKGLDIPLEGRAGGRPLPTEPSGLFGIVPDDYPGCIWKAAVKPGDKVKAGTPLLIDKVSGAICLTSPVAGSVDDVKRGERRKIEYVSVRREGDGSESFDTTAQPEAIVKTLQASGLWAMMRQRPYDIVPAPGVAPRDIFITAFDSAPLAPELLSEKLAPYLEKGIETLARLTSGKVYLSVRAGSGLTSKTAVVTEFEGPHPAGNVGVQIAGIKPVNKGETVWTLDAATAARIGMLYSGKGISYDTVVAVTGPAAANPRLMETLVGVAIGELLHSEITGSVEATRIISGNVLTGVKSDLQGFLRYPYRQVTLLPEGSDADEFMGWASMNPRKFSVKRTFPAFLRGLGKKYDFDARVKGGHRAMILSGEFDKVFPMDIYPEYLLKAIMARDIDRMEKLGIYEVAPEDFALPEFVDTSKEELQKTVRDGLDYLRKELS